MLNNNVADCATREQMRDMGHMRTEHELLIDGLLLNLEKAAAGRDDFDVRQACYYLREAIRPLLDARFGQQSPVAWSKPRCLKCGGHVAGQGPFCVDCEDDLDGCPACQGVGFVAVNTHGSGEDAVEVACETCNGSIPLSDPRAMRLVRAEVVLHEAAASASSQREGE